MRLGVLFGVQHRCQWLLLVCGDAEYGAEYLLHPVRHDDDASGLAVLLVPVHMGVCCAGGVPAWRCRLLCVVFPVLCMRAATLSLLLTA